MTISLTAAVKAMSRERCRSQLDVTACRAVHEFANFPQVVECPR
jgi:hypothetical protein